MHGHSANHEPPQEAQVPVDVTLERDIGEVEQAVDAYLQNPIEALRRALLGVLEKLDVQIALADAYQERTSVYTRFGSTGNSPVLGETRNNPVAQEVGSLDLQAQMMLVKAAKTEVTDPSPAALEALRTARNAVTRPEPKEEPVDGLQ